MSRCKCRCKCYKPNNVCCMPMMPESMFPVQGSCRSGCSFPCLIILILILLQFGSRCGIGGTCGDDCNNNNIGCGGLDRGILFIIALYYLSCCNPCA